MAETINSKLTANRPWMFRSRWRLFITLFLVLSIPTAILTALTAFFVSKEVTNQAVNQNTITARLVAKHLDEEFFGLRRYVESFATRWRIIGALERKEAAALQEQLSELIEQNSKLSRGILTDTDGTLLFDYPHDPSTIGKNFSYRDWFQGASQLDHPYVSGVYARAALDQKLVVTIATKINDNEGKLLGYLGAQATIKDITQWLASVQGSKSERIALFDQHGKQVLRVNAPEGWNISMHPAIQKVLHRPEGLLRIDDLDGFGRSIVSHVPIPDLGWTVIVYQDEAVIFTPVKRLLGAILIFFLIALAALGLLGWRWYRVLFAYAEDLRRTNKELENFCYSIAHDLRAPLRAMQGFTSLISEDYAERLDDEGKKCAHRVRTAAERMDILIRDLLEYGTVAHQGLKFEEVDLDEILQNAIGLSATRIKSTNADIDIHKPLGRVSADRKILERVLIELLSNALKYVGPNIRPKIKISSDRLDTVIRLRITDNGIGIAPEQCERIFGVFQRLHDIQSYSGTGIGLAIVKTATERMGGRVGVESQEGKGSAFWIELPTK